MGGWNPIGDEGAKSLATSGFGALTVVNLLQNKFSIETAQSLVEILKNHNTLKSLCGIQVDQESAKFFGAGLTDADAILISGDLRVKGALTILGLGENSITDVGAQALAASGFGALTSLRIGY